MAKNLMPSAVWYVGQCLQARCTKEGEGESWMVVLAASPVDAVGEAQGVFDWGSETILEVTQVAEVHHGYHRDSISVLGTPAQPVYEACLLLATEV